MNIKKLSDNVIIDFIIIVLKNEIKKLNNCPLWFKEWIQMKLLD